MSWPMAVCSRRGLVGLLDRFDLLFDRALAMVNPVTLRVGVTASHVRPPGATPGSAAREELVELTAPAALTKAPSHALSAFRTEQQKSQRPTMHRYASPT